METKSFTLIELLVVIVIIGILAGVIIVSTSSSISKANFAKGQAFSNTVQQELLLNLVSEWTFDEGNAEDSWGNNDGTVSGATHKTKADGVCVYGGCYSFDGDDYISLGNSNSLNLVKEITISIWGKSASGTNILIEKGGSFILRNRSNNKFQFTIFKTLSDWEYSSYSNNINDGLWHHVVGVYDGNYIKLYVDGVEQGTPVFYPGNINTSVNVVLIGKDSKTISNFFHGLIDDARIYNAALSTSQIKQNYIAGLNSLLASGSISKEEYDQRINSLALNND